MVIVTSTPWEEANQAYLSAALKVIKHRLAMHAAGSSGDSEAETQLYEAQETLQRAREVMSDPPALESLCESFGLTQFESDILLLCAGCELDAAFPSLCASAQGDPRKTYPTFSLSLAALPGPHWSALSPAWPLRRWRLLEIEASSTVVFSPLRIDERILHYLTGIQQLDERLSGIAEPLEAQSELAPSHLTAANKIAALWSRAGNPRESAVIQLSCDDVATKYAIAVAACLTSGLELILVHAQAIPTTAGELEAVIRLLQREAVLSGCAIMVDCDEDAVEPIRDEAISRLVDHVGGHLLLAGHHARRGAGRRPNIAFEIHSPTAGEQRAIWEHELRGVTDPSRVSEELVTQFDLSPQKISSACTEALASTVERDHATIGDLSGALWDACRAQTRPRLFDLAQRIESSFTWEDLVLPEAERQTLHEIVIHVRRRARVYEDWGFAAKSPRGLGISALFSGASGTGKTLAAEVLANELKLDLYRIDLSQVVSKYIGETEKNLRRVFDAAESGGAILLFDEADALFGKRTEVRDSHDRYANIEVSYLLQRMETYRGLAILTTNMKESLDPAFLRRIRFIVQFPFPSVENRVEIWRRAFPPSTPTEGLNADKLAQLNVVGGSIHNIALNSAFLAAEEEGPVRMRHILQAARSEYAKLEKPLSKTEVQGWE